MNKFVRNILIAVAITVATTIGFPTVAVTAIQSTLEYVLPDASARDMSSVGCDCEVGALRPPCPHFREHRAECDVFCNTRWYRPCLGPGQGKILAFL